MSGCVPQGISFRVDDRLRFTAPENRSTVRLPVTISWQIRDFAITGPGAPAEDDAGYFAIFLDTTPMPPGKDLAWVARNDGTCERTPGCPDDEYLNQRGVHTTRRTTLTLDQLPRTGREGARRERHRVTVVLLDSSGTRRNESAFELAFDLDRTVTR